MKRIVCLIGVITVLAACNSGGSKDEKKPAEQASDNTKNPDYQKGLDLVAKDPTCFTCHKIDEPLTGPSYRDVANKYANYPDTIVAHLAKKVREGGSGVWGEIFMTPHPDISHENAEAMVKYILLLKK
jgi:cytochrome c